MSSSHARRSPRWLPHVLVACSLATVARCNPQVIAFERGEAMREYDALLGRLDADEDKKITTAEMEAIEDEWLIDEVHMRSAKIADHRGNKDGVLERSEWVAYKTGEYPDAKTEL